MKGRSLSHAWQRPAPDFRHIGPLDYPSGIFTDYFVLLKVDGEWKIANKVWTRNTSTATP